jgi:site-specific DNA-methyltransferase (adenine-specific)
MTYELHHGDCLQYIKTLDTSRVDAIIADPPYGISVDASNSKYKGGVEHDEADWDVEPYNPAPIVALSKPTILWGANNYASRLQDFGGWLTWVKTARNGSEVRQAEMELAWTNCIRRPRVFRHLWVGAFRDSESGVPNVHPTQKPVALMRWCVLLVTQPGDTVFDPYMGSGSLGVACMQLGRNYIGCEIKQSYYAAAQQRIAFAASQMHLFTDPEQLALLESERST